MEDNLSTMKPPVISLNKKPT